MSVFTRLRFFTVLFTFSIMGAVACGGSSKPSSGSLEIDPSTATIAVGATQAFTVTLVLNGQKSDVTHEAKWTSSDEGVATVDASGVATAKANGMTTIVGTRQGVTVSAGLTVSDATLSAIEVAPNKPTIAAGTTQQFTATGTFSDGTSRDVSHDASISWKSSNTDKATISGSGLASAVAAGTANITASIGEVSGSTTLTVSAATLESVMLEPAATALAKGTTKQFKATAVFSDKSTQDVTGQASWSSSNGDVATVSDDDGSKGLVAGKSKGDATVTAAYKSKQGSASVVVSDASLASIALSPASASVPKGVDQVFAAIGTFSDGSTQDISSTVVWKTADPTLAAVSNAAGSKGRVTTLATGEVKITATTGDLSSDGKLTITDAALKSIAVSGAPSFAKGTHVDFTALATYTDDSTGDITARVTWSSTNTSVASISNADGSHGRATGEGQGTTKLTAAIEGISGSQNVTVTDAKLTSIAVSPGTKELAAGTTQQFIAMGSYTDGTTQDITSSSSWTSDHTDYATVSNAGGTRGLATAVAAGVAHITASIDNISSDPSTLTVNDASLTLIAVTPSTQSIAKGTTFRFTATGTFSNSTTQDLSTQVTWSAQDSNVATISNTSPNKGLASAVNGGQTTIRATFNSISGAADLTVTGATLSSIAITPPSPSVAKGSRQRFTATGTYSDTSTQDLTSSVVWTSETPSVATISNTSPDRGAADTLAIGTTHITAAYAGVTSPATTLTVTDAALVSIEVSPNGDSVPKGLTSQYTAIGTFSDATTQDLTTSVAWATGNSSFATITNGASGGLLSAVNVGTTTVTATKAAVMGATTIQVTAGVLRTLSVEPGDATTIARGTTFQYTATGTYTDNTVEDLTSFVTWNSSNSAIPISNGVGTKGSVTSFVLGDTNITASVNAITSNSAPLTVTNARLISVTVSPGTPSVPKGLNQDFVATGHYTDGTTQIVTADATWTSSNTNVATISNASGTEGRARALQLGGTTTITASVPRPFGGPVTDTATLSVSNAVLVSIDVTPAASTIAHLTSQHFTAIGTYSDATTQDLTSAVTWSSSNSSVAVISNAPGLSGLGSALVPGDVTVTATLGGVSGSTPFHVSNATLTSIDVTPPGTTTLPQGIQQPFQATGHFNDSTSQDLTWQVSWSTDHPNFATISNSLGSEGLASTLSPGTAIVSATFLGITGQATLVVTSAVPQSLVINGVASVPSGIQVQYTAVATFTDHTQNDVTGSVTWATSNSAVAVPCSGGTLYCLDTPTPGTSTISASIPGLGGTVSASRLLTVSQAVLSTINVTPPGTSVAKGLHQQFTATGIFTDGSSSVLTTQVTWTSSNATLVAISNAPGSEGLATALDVTPTNVTIQAASGTVTGQTTLAVTPKVLTDLQLTAAASSLPNGLTQQYTATGIFTDATQQILTDVVNWNTLNHAIATVSNSSPTNGLLTAAGVGSTDVTADYLGVHRAITVGVSMGILQAVQVTSPDTAIASGTTEQYTATGIYSDGTHPDLTTSATWSSSDPSATIVFNTGLATGSLPPGASVGGHTVITATYGGLQGTKGLDVTPAALASITVGSAQPQIPAGYQLQFNATGHYTDGTSQDLTSTATWTSSTPATVSIDTNTGLASALLQGSVTITATVAGTPPISNTRVLTVTAAVPTGLDVLPTTTSVAVGTKKQFVARAHFSDLSTQLVTTSPSCTWQSMTGSVATISNAGGSRGVATAVGAGSTSITASYGGFTTSATLNVTVATLASIAVTPATPSIPVGFNVMFHATGTYTDSTTQDLTNQVVWHSSDTNVATVDNTGTITSGTSSTLAAGSATISATLGSRTGSTVFTVTPATLVSMTVQPANNDIATCDCAQLTVTGTFSDATQYEISSSSSVALQSSNDNRVRVYQSGLVWLECSDAQTGAVTITATHAGDSFTGTTGANNLGACN
jgi:hypothetical protein